MEITKKRILIYAAIGLVAVIVIGSVIAMSMNREESLTVEELLSLGEKYLLDLNYEQALAQFLKVIEIEPMNPRAIDGAAQAYVGRGTAYVLLGDTEENLAAALSDYESAMELDNNNIDAWLGIVDVYIRRGKYDIALECAKQGYEETGNDSVLEKIQELESGNISDSQGQQRRMSHYNADRALVYYHEYTYNSDGNQASVTSYDSAGKQTGHIELTYDKNGEALTEYVWDGNTGQVALIEYIRDEQGKELEERQYGHDGSLEQYRLFQYNAAGKLEREELYIDGVLFQIETQEYDSEGRFNRRNTYDEKGDLLYYSVYERNENGRVIRVTDYGADGNLTRYIVSEYDTNGHHIRQNYYNADDTLYYYYIYIHDANGKIIKQERYNGDGTFHSSSEYSE